MINRINLILRAKNITAKQFAEEIGIQPSGMSHILSGRNNPSLEFVNKVIRRYPEIDANWLLLGKGQMYSDANTGISPSFREQTAQNRLAEETASEPTLFSESEQGVLSESRVVTPTPAPPCREATADAAVRPSFESEASGETVIPSLQGGTGVGESMKKEPAPIMDDGRRLVKILFFYDDRTFEEYKPL